MEPGLGVNLEDGHQAVDLVVDWMKKCTSYDKFGFELKQTHLHGIVVWVVDKWFKGYKPMASLDELKK